MGRKEKVSNEEERVESAPKLGQRSPLVTLSDAALAVEKVRVAAQNRLTHLEKRGLTCPDTQELLQRAQSLENWVDDRLGELVQKHPAYHWFSLVKGTGGEAIGKVLGYIERFGRFYKKGDPLIPPYVKRESIMIPSKDNPKQVEEVVWVEGIERLTTPSKLRRIMGLAPGQKRSSGQKLTYIQPLKVMVWRLGVSFHRAQNKYSEFYSEYKEYLLKRFAKDGIKVLPTPKGRYCINCEEEKKVEKSTHFCPDCGEKLATKEEPEGVIWQGHLHQMAVRRMLQLFSDHLWVVWREALGLPIRQPYPIEYGGHSRAISPWDMVDK